MIQNYIELECLRYGDRLKVAFTNTIDNNQTQIAPLIENTFKHGSIRSIENPIINIDLSLNNEQLVCVIFNTKPKPFEQNITNSKKDGIGLINTINKLELIYPN